MNNKNAERDDLDALEIDEEDLEQEEQEQPFFLWRYLAECEKPIVMFGTGDGADKILDVMERYGLKPTCFTTSGDFGTKPAFRDFPVIPFEQVEKKFADFVVLICFGTDKPEVLEKIYAIAER